MYLLSTPTNLNSPCRGSIYQLIETEHQSQDLFLSCAHFNENLHDILYVGSSLKGSIRFNTIAIQGQDIKIIKFVHPYQELNMFI